MLKTLHGVTKLTFQLIEVLFKVEGSICTFEQHLQVNFDIGNTWPTFVYFQNTNF